MRDHIGQPLVVGNRVAGLSNFPWTGVIIRFTTKMVVVEKNNKTKTHTHEYGRDLINLEASYEKYPELEL